MPAEHQHRHDPTFYRSPADAAAAPAEKLAYLATFSRPADKPDALAVVDVDPQSPSYASVIGFTELPNTGDELHHFGWNACSSALCPTGDHQHGDRRYLIVPGLRSSRLHVFDVAANPREVGSVQVGGIGRETPHPAEPDAPLRGGPQMVEVSRDGRRVYFTNSLYGAWDDQFYPGGVGAWMAKLDVNPEGGIAFDERFFPEGDAFRGRRAHQVRLQGGDASSDSYCFPS
jgi:hypothetical protein